MRTFLRSGTSPTHQAGPYTCCKHYKMHQNHIKNHTRVLWISNMYNVQITRKPQLNETASNHAFLSNKMNSIQFGITNSRSLPCRGRRTDCRSLSFRHLLPVKVRWLALEKEQLCMQVIKQLHLLQADTGRGPGRACKRLSLSTTIAFFCTKSVVYRQI